MTLLRIYRDIEERAAAVHRERAEWPCRRGCDHCCRSLGEVPRITRAEWQLLRAAIDDLPAEEGVRAREELAALPERGPMVCPLLDQDEGACRVYAARPAACRSYGYYVSRGEGLYCHTIEALDTEGLMLGNQDALERRLVLHSGPARTIAAWLAEEDGDGP